MRIFRRSFGSEIQIGKAAPYFELLDQAGEVHALRDYQGKWIVLYFYPRDDTPGCTKEACEFRDDISVLQSLNTIVLGISIDSVKSHLRFAEKYGLQFPLLSDRNGNVAKKYKSLLSLGPFRMAMRHTFIIDPDGDFAKIYRNVKPLIHSDEIVSDIKLLQQI